MFLRLHNCPVHYQQLSSTVDVGDAGTTLASLKASSQEHGIDAFVCKCSFDDLSALPMPAIVHLRNPSLPSDAAHEGHYYVLMSAHDYGVNVIDASYAKPLNTSQLAFEQAWSGYVLVRAQPTIMLYVLTPFRCALVMPWLVGFLALVVMVWRNQQ